ncbi:SDR family oxidoreductase [Trinickia dinghuensis]|uniref:SDR family NAD(P)-dependent oxidoreductase n=1 Tax=Trinickia dinghuensis TaxID=2291023 RepID=A0A3D8JY72_9BURK|nr:SDR family oxidoreductase [Trinickia dinghuensis]RDU97575.1 SDR family NAD(P)-dependent oxidoreductase [Trinickia dinghuensis]
MVRSLRQPKIVVVTGASAGVGRAAALAFARLGADVALLARDAEALEHVASIARNHGVRAMPIAVDVSAAHEVEAAANRIEAELGPIDVWVNNAMVTVFSPVARMKPEEFARVTEVTYLGYVWGTMAALERMSRRNKGVIVQVGSALAYRAIPLQSAYCGAKHAIRGFTDALRCELLHEKSGVHVTMVQMPSLNTPQFDWAQSKMPGAPRPVAPIYEPEVAARAIVWAATHRRRELYVGLPSIKAIVANKFIPGYLDRYLAKRSFAGQQRKSPTDPGHAVDLWKPVAGAHRLRGSFGAEAKSSSAALWLDTHRGTALGAALALGLVALLTRRRLASHA